MSDKESIKKRISEVEKIMGLPDFWSDKQVAQKIVAEYNDLKLELEGVGKYDRGNAVMTIFSGAGGDDAEDFSRMLLEMYLKYFEKSNWQVALLHENKNDHGGFRNVTLEITGKGAYGKLKSESGVHRLVRVSPFNAKSQRHTSFSMVEVVPEFEKTDDIDLEDKDLEIDFTNAGGPGGQNVNKRETAVRIKHTPTNLSVRVDSERSQLQNKEKALKILQGKIFRALEDERIKQEEGMYVSKTTDIEWGNQIRSYVLHPYKMVKDHRTNIEVRDVDKVLDGEIEAFLGN